MSFRPKTARWFELVTTKSNVAAALGALALSGAAELEAFVDPDRAAPLPELGDLLRSYRDVARACESYWPAPRATRRSGDPRKLLEDDLRRVTEWRVEADPKIARIERLTQERLDLVDLCEALALSGDAFPNPASLLGAGPRLAAILLRLPHDATAQAPVTLAWRGRDSTYLLSVGLAAEIRELAAQAPSRKGREVPLPEWLPPTTGEAREAVELRIAYCEAELASLEAELSVLALKLQIPAARADFALFEWLTGHAGDLAGGTRLVFVTGWTSIQDEGELQADLERRSAPCLVRFLDAPEGADPPLILENPRWARPFELFARMIGTPARHEADPSVVVAVIAPLLFGFMFGDVGQGLVLVAAGLAYRDRFPVLRLFVPAGAVATAFGLLFGSVFCFEALPALWLRPLDEPITLLAITLAIGAALIAFGLAIKALEAAWRGNAAHWWLHEAGLAAAYLAILSGLFWRPALWAALAGALWFVLGAARLARRNRMAAAGVAVAEFIEKLMQLLVNTISFSRVGAFALAHAGLSAAVVGLARTAGGGIDFLLVILAGNALILALEGLVVGIQTTRLMLFEFFIRFLEGGGRPLKPLTPPRDWRPPPMESLQPREI
jgi:V/A-type H+/Na+-transporting ATPase subunit I